jgi:Flp pilus assembly protein TadG
MVVWCLLVAILLLPIGGLSFDLWRGIAAQRALQSAAEDAAVAGASAIDVGRYRSQGCISLDPGLAEQMAEQNLLEQPVGDQVTAAYVTVSQNDLQLTVRLAEPVALTLLRLAGGNRSYTVTAEAVSSPVPSAGTGYC